MQPRQGAPYLRDYVPDEGLGDRPLAFLGQLDKLEEGPAVVVFLVDGDLCFVGRIVLVDLVGVRLDEDGS